ncbi:MAG: PTS sugar transporter subunit IIC [Deltaproteobacteria bacterium]|nr:PTS sugar transporter subunit IIC [Deltaproteobacteria bacterium]
MKFLFWQAFAAAVAGGFISLDRTAAFQIMISRPIVAGPLIGLVCGSLAAGIVIGSLLELLWIGDLPVGGHVPPHETAAAVIAAAVAANAKGIIPEKELFGFCILMTIPFAVLCQKADQGVRMFNKYYYHRAYAEIEKGTASGVGIFNLMAVLTLLIVNIAVFFFFITIGMMGVSRIYYIIPQEIRFAFATLFAVIPVIGIASAFNTAHSNKLAKTALFAVFILFIGLLAWHR